MSANSLVFFTLMIIFNYTELSSQSDENGSLDIPGRSLSSSGQLAGFESSSSTGTKASTSSKKKEKIPYSLRKELQFSTFLFPANRVMLEYIDTPGERPGFYPIPSMIQFEVQCNKFGDIFGFVDRPTNILKRIYAAPHQQAAINIRYPYSVRLLTEAEKTFLSKNPRG